LGPRGTAALFRFARTIRHRVTPSRLRPAPDAKAVSAITNATSSSTHSMCWQSDTPLDLLAQRTIESAERSSRGGPRCISTRRLGFGSYSGGYAGRTRARYPQRGLSRARASPEDCDRLEGLHRADLDAWKRAATPRSLSPASYASRLLPQLLSPKLVTDSIGVQQVIQDALVSQHLVCCAPSRHSSSCWLWTRAVLRDGFTQSPELLG
jgi:hypothetical protein